MVLNGASGDHYYWEGCQGGCISKVYTSSSVDPSVIKTRARSWCCHFHNSMKEVRSETLSFFLGIMVVSEEVFWPPQKKHPPKDDHQKYSYNLISQTMTSDMSELQWLAEINKVIFLNDPTKSADQPIMSATRWSYHKLMIISRSPINVDYDFDLDLRMAMMAYHLDLMTIIITRSRLQTSQMTGDLDIKIYKNKHFGGSWSKLMQICMIPMVISRD